MTQVLDPLPAHDADHILCCYVNQTSKIQIARITNIANWYFERVVFPAQQLIFESVPEAQLEIHTGMMATAILSDTIPCYRLKIQQSISTSIAFLNESEPEGPDLGMVNPPLPFQALTAQVS
ncbi:MAG: DUF1830 domain-containing protein [Acaryochloridaceae cyanobacterium SU_2_1]|nr:DUF1830 domain-containing protein [Acaryochloridaceae cyanobacterium SU_2_1]